MVRRVLKTVMVPFLPVTFIVPTALPVDEANYVPITLTNDQSSAAPTTFQQRVTWHPSAYQHDNGANVFTFHYSFARTSFSAKWATVKSSGGSLVVNNSASFTTSISLTVMPLTRGCHKPSLAFFWSHNDGGLGLSCCCCCSLSFCPLNGTTKRSRMLRPPETKQSRYPSEYRC